jgi:hypothetical protein
MLSNRRFLHKISTQPAPTPPAPVSNRQFPKKLARLEIAFNSRKIMKIQNSNRQFQRPPSPLGCNANSQYHSPSPYHYLATRNSHTYAREPFCGINPLYLICTNGQCCSPARKVYTRQKQFFIRGLWGTR